MSEPFKQTARSASTFKSVWSNSPPPSLASSLEDVEAAYHSAGTTGLLSTLTLLQLPAAWFDLVGLNLDTTTARTVIIRNTDQSVSSYQLLVVTFY